MGNKHPKSSEFGKGLTVKVRGNNVNAALQDFRRLLATERWVKDVRRKSFFESKSEIRRKAAKEAVRRIRKEARDDEESLTHNQIHHKSALSRGSCRRQRRLYDAGEGKFKKKDEKGYSHFTSD